MREVSRSVRKYACGYRMTDYMSAGMEVMHETIPADAEIMTEYICKLRCKILANMIITKVK